MVVHVRGIITFALNHVEMEVAVVIEEFANVPVNGKEIHVRKMSMNVFSVNIGTDVTIAV